MRDRVVRNIICLVIISLMAIPMASQVRVKSSTLQTKPLPEHDSVALRKIKENEAKNDSIKSEGEELKKLLDKADDLLYQTIIINRNYAGRKVRINLSPIHIPNAGNYTIYLVFPKIDSIPKKKMIDDYGQLSYR